MQCCRTPACNPADLVPAVVAPHVKQALKILDRFLYGVLREIYTFLGFQGRSGERFMFPLEVLAVFCDCNLATLLNEP